ncbi:MAG: PrpF domain-containing protein, partial [Aristaeellaceae bacterium]
MRQFKTVFMRGGTSKGLMFLEQDLPAREAWDDIFVQAMGSPDPKQIDGMGGCVSSNNKIVVVRPSERPGVDVDYIVGQSIVGRAVIDYKSNCGNMTAATAPYAIEMGLVRNLTEPTTVVHMYNLNTDKYIDVEVPVKNGQFDNEGECAIAGVDGTAGELKVNFLNPVGSKTGKLFPTGVVREMLTLPDGEIEATILDVSNPIVLVRAEDLGVT